ncbi:hypothetical protein M0802_000728 [Mischocyttarus mexicanus]|nr:hypothetical protein M0802_000728 [Mischocyttarus mexicanus]
MEEKISYRNKDIAKFYAGRSIFMTGASGFIGKVLMEKLLRSCPEIDKLYILIREKKGLKIQERLEKIFSLPLFDKLNEMNPSAIKKVIPISGDIKEKNLGIDPADRQVIIDNVSILIHNAASVRFDDSLQNAILTNTRSIRDLCIMGESMKKLVVLLHISSTYAHCNIPVVEEIPYESEVDWRDAIKVAENFDSYLFKILTSKYMKTTPNTYTFSKKLAENVVTYYSDRLPCVICRPSIVVSMVDDPLPGWIDNFNGPVGLMIASGIGISRISYANSKILMDYIPVDYAAKAFIIAMYIRGNKTVQQCPTPIVYNVSSYEMKRLSIEFVAKYSLEYVSEDPLHISVLYPTAISDSSVVLLPYYEDQGSGNSGCEMLTTNGQIEEDYRRRLIRQDDKRVSTNRHELQDFHEMNLNKKTFDEIIDRIDLKSFRQIDSSYEKIADLQEYIQEEQSTDLMVNALDVLLERSNSLNNDNYDQSSTDGSDLVERGSIRYKLTRNCPYSKNSTNLSARNQLTNMSFTRKQHKVEKSMVESKEGQTNGGTCSIFEKNWQTKTNDDRSTLLKENNSTKTTTTSIPSIVVNDHGENTVLTILGKGADHGAQVFSDASNSSIISQATRTWPDSPLSCYNNIGISRPNSRCSSCTQSPASGMQFESQLMPYNVSGSPLGSPQIAPTYTLMQGQSSPSSSSQSYGDIPSPLNYQKPVSQRVEERLHKDLASFSIWGNFPDGQGNTNETVPTFDNNELQLLDEVLRSQGSQCERNEEAQVVPRSDDYANSYDNRPSSIQSLENEIERMSSNKNDMETFPSTSSSLYGEHRTSFTNYSSNPNDFPYTYVNTQNPSDNIYRESQTQVSNFYDYNEIWNTGHEMRCTNSDALQPNTEFDHLERETVTYLESPNSSNAINSYSLPTSFQSCSNFSSMSANVAESRKRRCASTSGISYTDTSFNDFQIPEMVSSFKHNRSQRTNERSIMPWPFLNLPSTDASKRLKEALKPKDVEIAMSQLLEINDEKLAKVDDDGYTELMCLVSNPENLTECKAYLVPLVERLSTIKDALSRKSNRGEDALYLAAICCPEMPYIAGYLAATMLQKGIDINQNLYHTRGDTLIHSVSARGDSHGEVLAELLALKTSQGNAVFDLSKCNYDGRTALHVAVESHDPTGKNLKAMATVRLLLDNGADLNIRDTKRGDTALHMAAALSCDPALVKVLLRKAVPSTVNATNYDYNTPLHMAAACSNLVPLERQKEVCWLLTQAGGQTNIYNKQGKTPLALVSTERKNLIGRIFHKKF